MHLPWVLSTDLSGPPILTSVDPAESAELARLAKGRQVLEIGSAHGYSSVVMALAGAEHVTAVDNHSGATWLGDTRSKMASNLHVYGVTKQVTVIAADSSDALYGLVQEEKKFGLIFIDGDHSTAGVTSDIRWCLQLLDTGGTLAIHDYAETCCCPEVGTAVDEALGWAESRPAGSRPHRVVGTLWLREF